MSYQTLHGKSRNLLILDELCFRGLVHNWLSVMFQAAVEVIGHAQVGMTADREWIPCKGSTGRNGLENKRVSVVGTSRVEAGKSEEYVTIDINRLHVKCPVSLKRLWFDKVSSWPFEDIGLNRILLLRVVIARARPQHRTQAALERSKVYWSWPILLHAQGQRGNSHKTSP